MTGRDASRSDVPDDVPLRLTRVEKIAWPVLFLVIIAYGLSLLHGGYLFYEGEFFISHFLDDRSVFQKVFSMHANNWDCYQARELSFLFGLADAYAILTATRLGFPFLYSVTYVVAIFATAVMLWRLILRVFPRLSATDAGLIVSLMLASPAIGLSGYYYRPTRVLMATLLVMVLWQLVRLIKEYDRGSIVRDSIGLFVAAILMSWTDPQGAFFAAALVVLVALVADVRKRHVQTAIGILGSVFVWNSVYRLWIGPSLSTTADGFAPNMAFQRVVWRYTFGHAGHILHALLLWLGDFGHFFGNSGLVGGGLVMLLVFVAYWQRKPAASSGILPARHRDFFALVITAGLLLALYAILYAKMSSITWPESRRVYYWIPSMVILATIAAGALDSAIARSVRLRAPLSAALGVMICSSVLSLDNHADVVRHGEQSVMIQESARVRDCMRTARTPVASYGLSDGASMACSSIRKAAYGSAGPGPAYTTAVVHPGLWCRRPESD